MTIPTSPLDESRLDENTLSTGIPVLDTEILQGIPEGSTVAILGDPRGMGDLFLYHLVHTDRPTNYVSTVRPERHIEKTLHEIGDVEEDNLTVEDVYSTGEDPETIIKKHAARVKDGHNLIVDTFSNAFSKTSPEKFIQTLRNIYQYINDENALAYLYFANNDVTTLNRAEREALHMCDAVFRITTENTGDSIDTRLEILKLRGSEFPDEQVKLNVGEKLTIDTTRDIA